MEVHLLVLEGNHQGLRIKIPPTQFVIGRDPQCHLRPASSDVSRFHCAIARLGQQIMVRDLKSSNGTFLNDQRVTETVRVADGDVLGVGPLKLRFQVVMGPGSSSVRETAMSWLVRTPNSEEISALDPQRDTALLGYAAPDATKEGARSSGREGETQRLGSAVAGEFLREYLKRRNEPPAT